VPVFANLAAMVAAMPPVDLTPRPWIYLGRDPDDSMRLLSTMEPRDSVGVIGPPGYGKTAGIVIPAVLTWAGPVVSTSTRGDVLGATGNHRAAIAAEHGGRVYVYDPFASEGRRGTVGWSPLAGCTDPSTTYRRVMAMTAGVGNGIEGSDFWRTGASRLLRGYFHAAAVAGLGIREIRGWLAGQEVEEPAEILRDSGDRRVASVWARELLAFRGLGERERGSYYSLAANTLDATADPDVLDSCDLAGLDLDDFLRTRSTLYIVGPSHYQEVIAPLIVGLIDSIAQRAAEIAAAAGGKLNPPLLLALDELAAIAPIRSLPALVAEGGGRGINTLWATQNLSQVRSRYGAETAASIVSSTTAKVIYGGMSHGNDLRDISGWAGEHRIPVATSYSADEQDIRRLPQQPGLGRRRDSRRQTAVTHTWRPLLPVEAIQRLPSLHAWLFYRSDRPLLVATPPAGLVREMRAVEGYTPPPAITTVVT